MPLEGACPLCGCSDFVVKYVLADESFRTVTCNKCKFSFMHPYPSDEFLDDYYKNKAVHGFEGESLDTYVRPLNDRIVLFENLLRKIDPPLTGGHAVDFGAGAGLAVAALKRLGFDAIGTEKNPRSAAVAKKLFGVEIVDQTLDELPGSIRLFTMFDVLEHIKYPVEFLRYAASRMSADACFIGAVPNYNSIGRILHGTESASLAFPDHVNQFTKGSLIKTLNDSGFDVLYTGFPPPYGATITLGLRNWLAIALKPSPLRRFLMKTATLIKKYLVYPLPNIFAERTGLFGQSLVFVARRRA
ncbi:MAG TPA: methyltransferase domain-containing protein [Aliidongia sp.]|uniref:methyltransferase domain-containing protein n=1 Tax=Aliidongia sp. TaxID=1914230 RepID=UPI002DDCAE4F|nr:methyltransferase domain-containing protein [Aliidongia sp.]HEV2677812.1 methyltransferase domain-containing protein [Aliidongia sp.]